MDFKINSCKRRSALQRIRGGTLTEMLMAIMVSGIVLAGLAAFTFNSSRSLATYFSAASWDAMNRNAVDVIGRDVRACREVTSYTADSISLKHFDNSTITYTFSGNNLTRAQAGSTNTLLTDLSWYSCEMQSRQLTNGTFWYYPSTNAYDTVGITFSWCGRRTILGKTTEDLPQYVTYHLRNK